jgi:hypothetical protein
MMDFLNITKEQATTCRAIMERTHPDFVIISEERYPPEEVEKRWPKTVKTVRCCYNRPFVSEIQMLMMDEVIDTFGVEFIDGAELKSGRDISYLNTGDTYDNTVILYEYTQTFTIAAWGDLVK